MKAAVESHEVLLFTLMMSVNLWYRSLLMGCRTRSSAVVLFKVKYSAYVAGWPAKRRTSGFSVLYDTVENYLSDVRTKHTYRAKGYKQCRIKGNAWLTHQPGCNKECRVCLTAAVCFCPCPLLWLEGSHSVGSTCSVKMFEAVSQKQSKTRSVACTEICFLK